MKQLQYEKVRIGKMLINCIENDKRNWCTECSTPCKEYEENRKLFWKKINEADMKQIEKIKIKPGIELPTELEAKLIELKNQQDDIDTLMEYIQDQENDEELQKLDKQLTKVQEKIKTRESELKIPENIEMLSEIQAKLNEMLKSIGSSVDDPMWGPDAFSKGKKEAISSRDGIIVVLRTTKRTRTIIPSEFVAKYPLLTNKFVEEGRIKITLTEAEKELGVNAINEMCNVKVDHGYELQIKDGRNIPTS
jgi:molybdopterin converting factor small subunit